MHLVSITVVIAISAFAIVAFRVQRERALRRAVERTRALVERARPGAIPTNDGG
jgi:hypothetical protein